MFKYLVIIVQVTSLSRSLDHGFSFSQEENINIREEYPTCAFGTYQTPIHIQSHLVESVVMPALDFRGYNNFLPPPVKITNNGHTGEWQLFYRMIDSIDLFLEIQAKITIGEYKDEGLYSRPAIRGGFLLGEYFFHSLHFHWGQNNGRGSEHVIENVRYPMEMHAVHINANYSSWDEATKHKDGFVVLAFFYQVQVKENRRYNPIVDKLEEITLKGTSAYLNVTLPLVSLLPKRMEFFYIYEGSLTSPPCSEAVIWILFPDPILISFHQMEKFRNLGIGENFRRLQPVGQRKIYFRSPTRFVKPHFTQYLKDEVSSKLFWLRT